MDIDDAAAALNACMAAGVSEFAVCGGARDAELVALISRLEDPRVRLWTFPEERVAAFYALGRARGSGRAVAVVTTSGTAAAELLPAAVEAYYQSVPLVLLTADRPLRFRSSGAPQAIEQEGLFGIYAESDFGAWDFRSPLHLNVCLEEPTAERLSVQTGPVPGEFEPGPVVSADLMDATRQLQRFLVGGGELMVMLGCLPESWRAPVLSFLKRARIPTYAEATSGLREVGSFPRRRSLAERVLRIGGVPSCRSWRDLESRPEIPVFSVAPNGLPGMARPSEVVRAVDWEALTLPPTLVPASPEDEEKSVDEIVNRLPLSEAGWIRSLSDAIPPGALVFLGNSLPIREWNRFASRIDRGLRCFANRGANGIDGILASFFGIAEGEDESWLITGDLSVIYDLSAPWVLPQSSPGRRRLVVINNGGGRIFERLPALRTPGVDTVRDLLVNSHSLRFDHWAAMWGLDYQKVSSPVDLHQLPDGNVVVEVLPDEAQSEAVWEALEGR